MSNIYLEVNGERYTGFTNIQIDKSIPALSGKFTFATTVKESPTGVIQNDLKAQDSVRIFIDDNVVLTGYIDNLSISYSTSDHQIVVQGREKTSDLVDCSIIANPYLQKDFTKLARIVLKDNGYNNISIINKVGNLPVLTVDASEKNSSELPNNEITTQTSESIAEFLYRYARQIQVLLLTNEDGNIEITKEGSNSMSGDLISSGDQANILSASIGISTAERFRTLKIVSQGSSSDFTQSVIEQEITKIDNQIRSPRRIILTVPTNSQVSSITDLANWNINIRRAKGTRYNCTVQGFYNTRSKKELWKINNIVQINDDKFQINGLFLIEAVTFSKDLNGSFTDLSIVKRGSFSAEPQITRDDNNFGEDLIAKLSEGI